MGTKRRSIAWCRPFTPSCGESRSSTWVAPRRSHAESAGFANEAYLKLIRAGGIRCENRVHFLAPIHRIMRRILTVQARGRGYAKQRIMLKGHIAVPAAQACKTVEHLTQRISIYPLVEC